MSNNDVTQPVRYATSPRYKLLVLAGFALAALFGWELWRAGSIRLDEEFSWGYLLFFGVTLLIALWYAREMLSVVLLSARGLTVTRRPGAGQTVEFRQMVSVSESGRMGGRSITVIYYPLRADGLVDLDGAASLIVPEVDKHDELLAALEARVPA